MVRRRLPAPPKEWRTPLLPRPQAPAPFELEEATIFELQEGMRSGRYTARAMVELYLGLYAAAIQAGGAYE